MWHLIGYFEWCPATFKYFRWISPLFYQIHDKPPLSPHHKPIMPPPLPFFFFLATLLTIKPSQKSAYNHGNQNGLIPFTATHTHKWERNADRRRDIPWKRLLWTRVERALIFFCATQRWLNFKDTSSWPLWGKVHAHFYSGQLKRPSRHTR